MTADLQKFMRNRQDQLRAQRRAAGQWERPTDWIDVLAFIGGIVMPLAVLGVLFFILLK